MTKFKIISYSLVFLLFLCSTGCSNPGKQASGIRGKFLFDSNRLGRVYDTFITENGKTRLLLKNASSSAWSSDGKMIACRGSTDNPKKYGFWILDFKGNKKKFVETPEGIPGNLSWSPDSMKIYYTAATIPYRKLGHKNKVYYYDFIAKTHMKIIELDEVFTIVDMILSPKGDKLLLCGSNKQKSTFYLSNSNGTDLGVIRKYGGTDAAWYPDNEHIIYLANISEDGQAYIKEGWGKIGWGYFFKMNINTGKVEKLWLCKTPFLLSLKISQDGKYIYYTAAAPGGGRAVFVSPIDNPGKKIQITYPIFLTPATHGRSQDWNPDWYQG